MWPGELKGLRCRGLIAVDSIGIGSGVVDALEDMGFSVSAFNSSARPLRRQKYMNARAEAFWQLRQQLEDGELDLPPDELLFDELLAIQWRPTAEGKIRIEDKGELKARLGRSPDRADALAMAAYSSLDRRVVVSTFPLF
jgi:hypothetical protein